MALVHKTKLFTFRRVVLSSSATGAKGVKPTLKPNAFDTILCFFAF